MYRIWQKLPSGTWIPLELACRDKDFLEDVVSLYCKKFQVVDMEIRSEFENENTTVDFDVEAMVSD